MSDFNAQVIDEFRANGGHVGGMFEGQTLVLLHSVGAKSGTTRIVPLVAFPQPDGSQVVVGSAAGSTKHPAWYHNLQAAPEVQAELGTDTAVFRAADVADVDRDEVWAGIVAVNPGFADYEPKAAPRVLPLVRLVRT